MIYYAKGFRTDDGELIRAPETAGEVGQVPASGGTGEPMSWMNIYDTATINALLGTKLDASDITSGTITPGTSDIDFDNLGAGLESLPDTEPIAGGWWNNDGTAERSQGIAPDPGKSYSDIAGTPPSILSAEWLPWAKRLKNRRDANVPLVRSNTYHFASNGDDDTNLGTEASPWRSLAKAARLASTDYSARLSNSPTVSDPTQYELQGQSFSVFGWAKPLGNVASPWICKVGEWSVLWGAFRPGIGNDFRIAFRMGTATNNDLIFDQAVSTGTWYFVCVTYDLATQTATLSVNGSARVSDDVGLMPDPATVVNDEQQLKMTQQYGSGSTNGSYAKTGIYTRAISRAEELALYNGGNGVRYDLLTPSQKSGLLSWWEMSDATASSGAQTLADSRGVDNLTVASSSYREPWINSDPAITAAKPYGCDTSLRFRRGDKFVGSLKLRRPGLTVGDFGEGELPVISKFDVEISGSWSLVSGTTYKIPLATPVGWIKKVGDDHVPFDLVLSKAADGSDCQVTANSFWYDTGNNELHLNVGEDPSGESWEGTTAQESAGLVAYTAEADGQRIENIVFLGSGISEPGADSGYGLQITSDGEFYGKNIHAFYTGYHAIGQIADDGIVTLENCKAGLCCNRNQSDTLGDPANGTVYVSYDGSGGQEWIMWNCEATHGPLPSYDWTGNSGFGGMISHGDATDDYPALTIAYGTSYPDTDYECGYSTNITGPEAADWGDLRSWVVDETVGSGYSSLFGIRASTNTDVACVNSSIATESSVGSGYLLGANGSRFWLVNCTLHADLEGHAGGYNIVSNIPSGGTTLRMIGCHVEILNHDGELKFATETYALDATIKNTIFTVTGNGSWALGTNVDSDDFDNCAFFGTAVATGDNPVTLSSQPTLGEAPPRTSELFGAGEASVIEYDSENTRRSQYPTIGPIEAERK